MAVNLCSEFPVWGLVPKKETGVVNFLNKFPEYDGRDMVVAILDSGVDPAAPGLSHTTLGLPKVLERFDCSGAGDVDTSTIVCAKNGSIVGLSGRVVHIPSEWKNPTNVYHLGLKSAYELYPTKLKERIMADYTEKCWDPHQQHCVANATRKLSEFESKHGNVTLTYEQKLEKEDLEARLDCLTSFEKKYKDAGPTYDCIVFHDGNLWRVCIDTTLKGEVSKLKLFSEYSQTQAHAYLTEEDQFTISVNVYDDGNRLEIVGVCSSHGTHVASITAACFPDCPAQNGIAPGAQIVSLTIGDGRLQGMETGTALVRAMIKIIELKEKYPIHVVNMSYGEHSHWANSGRVGQLMNEIVNEHGIVWVASAGNHGPALCTVGSPPDISEPSIIGVGAYVSPDMMVAEYAIRQKIPGMPYTWSSRGPTIDGHNGVSICAPGGAITSVPRFTLRGSQLMNGTSMSAPHVAGAVACLLSGLTQKKIEFSPYNVKRALENSAQFLPEVEAFVQGYGLLQVEAAFDLLVKHSSCPAKHVRLDVTVGGSRSKGIHLRTPFLRKKDFSVTISPFFRKDDAIGPLEKTEFSLKLVLTCSADYIDYPAFLDLANMARSISIQIDPSHLETGVYHTTVNGYDARSPEKGPLLRIPITIVKPINVPDPVYNPHLKWNDVNFKPNTIRRHFITVPADASWAVLHFQTSNVEILSRFMVHTMQIFPKKSCKMYESQKFWSLDPLSDSEHVFSVVGGLVLEVCIAKYWATIENVDLSYSLSFHGIKPTTSPIIMHAAEGIKQINIRALKNEDVAPAISLQSVVFPLRPTDTKVNPLSTRDIIPPKRQIYELVLTYGFHVTKQTEVMPNCCTVSDMLYESEFESQLWFLFDNNKQLITVGDAYPKKYTMKLEKGDYILKLQIRHDKKELLESYLEMPVLISQRLPSPITMDVYASKNTAILREKKITTTSCNLGSILPIYITSVPSDKLPKVTHYGQYLVGQILFSKDETLKKVNKFTFIYLLQDPPKKPVQSTTKLEKERIKHGEYMEALKDLQINWLIKLEGSRETSSLYTEMLEKHKRCVSVSAAMLQSLEAVDVQQQIPKTPPVIDGTEEHYTKIESIANEIIEQINQNELLAFYGLKCDTRLDAAKIKIEMDRQRNALLEALTRKGIVTCKRFFRAEDASKVTLLTTLSNLWQTTLNFADQTDQRILLFSMWHAAVHNHYGRLLKFLLKYGEEKSCRSLEQKIIEVLETLNWDHCVHYVQRAIPLKYPSAYASF